MKTLGVIGGLGPMATAYFLRLLTQMSDAETDQEHMDVFVFSKPSIPDRTNYILGFCNDNPVPEMVSVGRRLKENGADIIAIPCITAHYFHNELEEQIGLPIINAIEETVQYLLEKKIGCVGIMATDGTIQSRLFQNALENTGIRVIVPDDINQQKVMHLIYHNVKAGKEIDMNRFREVSENLFGRGAQVILLGCTELSLIKRDYLLPPGYLDVMEVLAQKAIECCGVLKNAYRNLITGETIVGEK